ncbi:hypothetical protein PTSG_08924 [Salpingoeca rosetta]|uniref:DJ-1/PfpI domain-containing protein n=1 Tax=Salpingoeca rosetta (strain ATCC 50818 / BSB-021) TaxID=946362 RepID=F2UL34_SALR5|nr:uncharacterized protein PTSG_08924 [Salpingoeca rosetta]EGD77833.1 hypothetical protein PTSG_08924 [Salpingoeca rosetta]|eukprot:XP_004990309.1 hypothetical protein PTSG_08924 [Salpingoeca rosetta]
MALRHAGRRVAVFLSGCGVYDGAEIHEASAALVSITRAGAKPTIFAPNKAQMHVIDHTTGNEMKEERNVLLESARIARGDVKPMAEFAADQFDALIVPGGFGAAKNLCDFAVKGADCTVDSEVEAAVRSFHDTKKPMGFCCIAPVIPAKLFKGKVTVGLEEGDDWPYAGTAEAIRTMGATHEPHDLSSVCVDDGNNIVTSAAFMCNAPFHQIHDNVAAMVNTTLDRIKA